MVSILSSERGVIVSSKKEGHRVLGFPAKEDLHKIISLKTKVKNDLLCEKMKELKENI